MPKKHGLKPRARIVATANMGDCPTLMLNAPVPAAKKVLAKAGLTTTTSTCGKSTRPSPSSPRSSSAT
jgi:acetyl-CoA acetyltransferase